LSGGAKARDLGHLAGSDYLYLHGGHLTGKWQRIKPSADV